MIWPPALPDINPIENLWSMIKRNVYMEGRQYRNLTGLWDAVVLAASKISPQEIKILTSSVDNRLLSVVQKKGGFIGY